MLGHPVVVRREALYINIFARLSSLTERGKVMDETKYAHVEVPSAIYLNQLLNGAVNGTLTNKERALIRHFNGMVVEGCDMGTITKCTGPADFNHWIEHVQTVMLRSANDGAMLEWDAQYNKENSL